MSQPNLDRLRSIKTLPSLVAYLRDELDWPLESDDIEDISFDYTSAELGLAAAAAVRIKEIKQLRPLHGNQPWGIFWVNFEKKQLPVVVMRLILRALVLKKRASPGQAERQAWAAHDLLFISAYGEETDRAVTFAHFVENPGTHLAELRVLGWDDDDTPLKMDYVARILHDKLTWDAKLTKDPEVWRARWSDAFLIRHRFVITKSDELAAALAVLARRLRGRIRTILRSEDGFGEIRKLQRAFRASLIHDLDDDGFADMFAQTVTYGLFSVSVRRTFPGEGTAVIKDDVPNLIFTSPFLKEMLGTFLGIRSRKGAIDFDELGVSDVTDLLTSPDTHMEVVLADFNNKTRGEDPVIHFYEHFLGAYNKALKIQRGVFYTPNPVVSYIVRSVHELLQSEFGLTHGLADTTTWGAFIQKSKINNPQSEIKLPPLTDLPGEKQTISPDEPFVQILDPATGTATFLVEVIDVIYNYLKDLWQKRGAAAMPSIPNSKSNIQNFSDYWNEYVPKSLLPRLHGYELMMAPYAIAHMKIGLKLAETGYKFATEERARIYLTNALEPWVDKIADMQFDALAHEAEAVNKIKRHKRFTVVIGNPPYSKISSNLTPEMRATVERYRYLDGEKIKERGALQFEINLQDDYVKFFRLCEQNISRSNVGVLGLITNNGYLSTPTLRGMRDSLLETFSSIWTLDLHGHVAKGEVGPDGAQEENVFDIVQGVSVFLGDRTQPKAGDGAVLHAECYGSRAGKYSFLQSHDRTSTGFADIAPSSPFYLFIPHDADLALEWKQYVGLAALFPKNSAGIITARDGLVIAHNKRELAERLERFSQAKGAEDSIYEEFGFSESKRFDLREAQSELRKLKSFSAPIRRMLHRPFDERFVFFNRSVVWSLSRPMADQMEDGLNLALVATRQVTRPQFEHAFVSRHIIEIKACSHDRNTQIFPLFICGSDGELALSSGETSNLNPAVLAELAKALGLRLNSSTRQLGTDDELSPLRLFNFAYAIFHCPAYRERYFEFLRSDFPRLPLTGNLALFRALARLGGELTALHLLEAPQLATVAAVYDRRAKAWRFEGGGEASGKTSDGHRPPLQLKFIGGEAALVSKPGWSAGTVWLDSGGKKAETTAGTTGFRGVPEAVWNFHIGGYQVCQKWLKDRKGRTLTKDDLAHYHKIVIALSETIRLMAEIDEVIETAGGWPGAFATPAPI